MSVSTAWAVPSPLSKYGGAFMSPASTTADNSPLAQVAGPGVDHSASRLSPSSPMFWVGAALLGAVGLAAMSTTVRVGPVRASASVGDA